MARRKWGGGNKIRRVNAVHDCTMYTALLHGGCSRVHCKATRRGWDRNGCKRVVVRAKASLGMVATGVTVHT